MVWFVVFTVILIFVLFLAITFKKPDSLLAFSTGLMWLLIVVIALILICFFIWRVFLPNDPVIKRMFGFSSLKIEMPNESGSEYLESAQADHEVSLDTLSIAQALRSSDNAMTQASEIFARRSAYKQFYILNNASLYSENGVRIGDLRIGRSVRVNFDDRIMPSGFTEYLVKTVILEDDKEQEGYVRQSAVSKVSLLEEKERNGFVNSVWWDLPSDDKNVIMQKAVNLAPGQMSETLVYISKEEASGHFFRNDNNIQYTAWVNGKQFFFGPSKPSNQKLPDFRDFLSIKVQLSPLMSSDGTIRFVVTRAK